MARQEYDGLPPEKAPKGVAISVALVTCRDCGDQIILKRSSVQGPYWWQPYGWHRLDDEGVDNGHKGRLYCPQCGDHIRETRSKEAEHE